MKLTAKALENRPYQKEILSESTISFSGGWMLLTCSWPRDEYESLTPRKQMATLPTLVFGALQKKIVAPNGYVFMVQKRRCHPFTLLLSRWFCCFGCILVPHTFDTTRSYSTPIRAELWGKYSCWCCLVKRIFHICNERVYHHRSHVTWHTAPRIQTRILPCKMWSIVFFFQNVCQNPTPHFGQVFCRPV